MCRRKFFLKTFLKQIFACFLILLDFAWIVWDIVNVDIDYNWIKEDKYCVILKNELHFLLV